LPDEEVVSGVVSEMGMTIVEMPRVSDAEKDVRDRLHKAEKLLAQGYDFVHLHTKEPDFTSHWNDSLRTKEALEAWDRGFATYWERLAKDTDLLTVLTSDHSTPSQWQDRKPGEFNDQHSGEPCPMTIRGRHVRKDHVTEAGERPAATGGLGLVRGGDLMDLVLSLSDRTNVCGMRPTPVPRKYRPHQVEPFTILPD
jgi:2,3-bisphosphoglycerate-independent phosphoglycerate mutase